MKKYALHSPRHGLFGLEEPYTLENVTSLAKSLGLSMKRDFIPDRLNPFVGQNPKTAVIFDVESEDVIMVEEIGANARIE